jgi:hypothetical protein
LIDAMLDLTVDEKSAGTQQESTNAPLASAALARA